MDPYKVLGLSSDASLDEIKEAYKNILNEYNSSDLDVSSRPLAEEVISEANIAYDVLTNGDIYKEIRVLIDNNNLPLAESKLNLLELRDSAEWNYLKGFLCFKKGWFDIGIQHIITATQIEPDNIEYSKTLNTLKSRGTEIINHYRKSVNAPPQNGMNACGGGGLGGGGGSMC